jgi:hypothetical protein
VDEKLIQENKVFTGYEKLTVMELNLVIILLVVYLCSSASK